MSVFGNSQIVRKYSNEFLNIGAGARGLAMGGAVISNQNDVYAPMWNPAGLTEVEREIGKAQLCTQNILNLLRNTITFPLPKLWTLKTEC